VPRCPARTIFLALLALAGGFAARGQPPATAGPAARTDLYGDPLPEGALTRLGTPRMRHPGRVLALAYAPDGKTLAVFHSDLHGYRGFGWGRGGGITLWDLTTGKVRRRLADDQHGCLALTFSADGTLLAFADHGGVHLFDPATGNTLETLRSTGDPLNGADLAPTGKAVATGSARGMRLYFLKDGKKVRSMDLPGKEVSAVGFSPNGATLAALHGYDPNERLRLWDVASGRERVTLPPGSAGRALAFSPDGKVLAVGRLNQPIRLWDVATGQELRALGGPAIAWSVAFSSDGTRLLAARNDGAVLFDVATGKEIRRVGDKRTYYTATFAPNGKTLALADDRAVRVFDAATGEELRWGAAHAGHVEVVGFSPDGRTALTGADGLFLWDAVTGKRLSALGPRTRVSAAVFAPDGKAVLAGYANDPELCVWDAATGLTLSRFEGKPLKVEFAGFLEEGRSVVALCHNTHPRSGYLGRDLHVWDRATGKQARAFNTGRQPVGILPGATADCRRLAAGVQQITIWDAASGQELAKIGRPEDRSLALALPPDGRRLALVSMPGRLVLLWEIATGREAGSILGHDAATVALAVSPDGRVLATGGSEGTVGLWELATGKELRKFTGHDGPVVAVAFSADGRRLISGGRDTTALIWDTADLLPKEPQARLDPREVEQLGFALAVPDAAVALRAVQRLARAPDQTLPYLREQLGQLLAADPDRVPRLLADLDARSFAKREAANEELARLGPPAEAGLKRLLESKPSLEVRKRAEVLLKRMADRQTSPAVLLPTRAVEVLELIATPDTRRLIEMVAKRSLDPRVSEEAQAALARLARR
jgi:WD40 repeat protein